MLTCAKLNVHLTKRFEGHVRQVLYLCTGEPYVLNDEVLYRSAVGTLCAQGIFMEQQAKVKGSTVWAKP